MENETNVESWIPEIDTEGAVEKILDFGFGEE